MHTFLRLCLPILATLVAYGVLYCARTLFRELTSPLRKLVGPRNPSLVFGNFKELENVPWVTRKWRQEFGPTFQFRDLFSIRTVYTADPIALEHIFKHNLIYQKPIVARGSGNSIVGKGLLAVEGEDHRRQASLNPAFGATQIRNLTDVFMVKSLQLRDIWMQQVGENSTRIDVLSGLSKMTLDVIGQAGFDYELDSLNPAGPPNEIQEMLHQLLHAPNAGRASNLRRMQPAIPLLRLLPLPGRKLFRNARKTLFTVGSQMIAERKDALAAAGESKDSLSEGRDLFSLLLSANLDAELPEHHRMSDVEVRWGENPSAFFYLLRSSSSAISWALHALSINQAAQAKLREELLTLPTDNPTLEQLDSLPYLEWVVRETMRVHAPVSHVTRLAMADDLLPLGTPYTDTDGKQHDTVPIRTGQIIRIPIADVNTETGIWGDDAADFRPERWENIPEAVHGLPGVWANLLTFLAGPHNCIGFRFSLAEQKVLLFVLLRAFKFERAVPDDDIQRSSTALQSPVVRSEREKGSQMPLLVNGYTA
ncbi:cytochrome P450 monooxygenase [Mycena latifolia]|nr:cytochrome P450 monooxygenase [Mycena latifolia]